MQKRNIKLDVNGLILVNKPRGMSSNQALTAIKKKFHPRKAGHTGTLDPLATGLLPICLGQATKFSSYLLDEQKTYQATIQLGYTSSTGDAEGEITPISPNSNLSKDDIYQVLEDFKGEISQLPPMYSALKHNGKPLYKYAREGIEIERKSRNVSIYGLSVLKWDNDELTLDICCSKGTYIRTLAADIGDKLETGAYIRTLHRTSIGKLEIKDAISLDELDKIAEEERYGLLKPMDSILFRFDAIYLNKPQVKNLKNGIILEIENLKKAYYRLYDDNMDFIGLGYCYEDGYLKVRRLLNTCE